VSALADYKREYCGLPHDALFLTVTRFACGEQAARSARLLTVAARGAYKKP
jgi:hypothetical protein